MDELQGDEAHRIWMRTKVRTNWTTVDSDDVLRKYEEQQVMETT